MTSHISLLNVHIDLRPNHESPSQLAVPAVGPFSIT